ncbi:MAG: class II aldolase/adducin family protein [Woeseiaceae bacterium]
MKFMEERKKIIKTISKMQEAGLIKNTSGNVSIKIDQNILITPSGKSYDELKAEDLLLLDKDKNVIEGELIPSSETNLHYSLYNYNDKIKSIVHTHSIYATAASTVIEELPPIHYQIADLGGTVPVVPYETFGTDELASTVTEHLGCKNAVLMKNHGAVTVAKTIEKALSRAILLEWLCSLYLISNQSGNPSILTNNDLNDVKKQMSHYQKMREMNQ